MAEEEQYGNWLPTSQPSSSKAVLQEAGVYVLAQPPPVPPKPDSPSNIDDDDDYDDASVVTAMIPENQAAPSVVTERRDMDHQKASSNSGLLQRKDSRRCHIIVLYLLVLTSFVMWTGLILILSKKSSDSDARITEKIQPLNLNHSEMLMKVRKDLDYVQESLKIFERTVNNNFSVLQDITESICSNGNSSASSSCPRTWKAKGKNCYYLSTESKNWTEALWQCIIKKAHLVSIWSDNEQGFLRDNLNSSMTYWLGMAYMEREKKWRWKEGDLHVTTAFWNMGEPKTQGKKNCGIMHPNGTWATDMCSRSHRWICKKKLIC